MKWNGTSLLWQQHDQNFPNWKKTCRSKTKIRRWESVSLFKNKNYNKVHQVYQVSQNGWTRPYDGH